MEHLPLAVFIGSCFYFVEPDLKFLAAAILFGYLLDADHLVDFFIFKIRSQKAVSLREFLSCDYFTHNQLVIVPLHSWEVVILLVFLSNIFENKAALFTCCAVSMAGHLLQDQLTNKPSIFGYSLIFRWQNNFDFDAFCKQNKGG